MRQNVMKPHSPLRSCIVCGNKDSKRNLLRIASTSKGEVGIDSNGPIQGRGAYVCTDIECAVKKLTMKHLEYALRTKISEDNFHKLCDSIECMNDSNLILKQKVTGVDHT